MYISLMSLYINIGPHRVHPAQCPFVQFGGESGGGVGGSAGASAALGGGGCVRSYSAQKVHAEIWLVCVCVALQCVN